MSRKHDTPAQQARETRRQAQSGAPHRQHFGNREFQRGTERNEQETEAGLHRDNAGSLSNQQPGTAAPGSEERGDDRRPYRRAGH